MALTLKEQQAKNLFLHTDQTQAEIADLLDIDRKTLHLWIKKGMWEELKRSAEQTPSVILQNIYNHIYRINKKIAERDEEDQCPSMQEVEMLRKLVIMTKAFPQKHTGTYIDVFSEFTIYLLGQNQPLAKEVTPYFDNYVNGVLKDENRDIAGYARRVKENLDTDPHFAERKPEPRKEETKQRVQKVIPRSKASEPVVEPGETTNLAAWGKNGEFQIEPENVPEPAPINTYEPKDYATNSPSLPLENLYENGEFKENSIVHSTSHSLEDSDSNLKGVAVNMGQLPKEKVPLPEGFPPEDWGTLPADIRDMEPSKRPSPFRHNETIWINHANDVRDSERKMSDTIKYYPDIDPLRAFEIKTFEFRMQQRNAKPQETPHQKAAEKTEQQYMQAQMVNDFYHEMRRQETRKNDKRW